MKFTDPELVQTRARAVLDLLPASAAGRLSHSETRVQVGASGAATFNALSGRVQFQDTDGEEREVALPDGITSEAVAATLFALSSVEEWS